MNASELHLVVPGPLEQQTGGYIYDARMAAGLRRLRWRVIVHNLEGTFPDTDDRARASLAQTLSELPDGSRVLIDGLAMAGLPDPVRAHGHRLRIVALVHHPQADETGLDPQQRDRFATSEREALAVCAGVLVTSEFTASRITAFGVEASRVRAVPPGAERAQPAEGPGPGEPPRLLCVGSVIPRKGQDVLVRALGRLREARWSCACAGSLTRAPDYARTLQEQVRTAGLVRRICFPGECEPDALTALYNSTSVFVLPSRYEGYGMALTEAMARGLPVIGTTGGAIPQTVPGDAGVLVPPGDDEALARAIGDFLPDAPGRSREHAQSVLERRAKVSAAARRYVASLPDWSQAAVAFAEAVRDLTPDAS